MSSILTLEQQIAELRLELAQCDLTRRERTEALAELARLKERRRIDDEAAFFAAIEREVEREVERLPPRARRRIDEPPF
jgi:predicted 2-oxoglutarate/Fe(II)-dependent dioxygenase YbiX